MYIFVTSLMWLMTFMFPSVCIIIFSIGKEAPCGWAFAPGATPSVGAHSAPKHQNIGCTHVWGAQTTTRCMLFSYLVAKTKSVAKSWGHPTPYGEPGLWVGPCMYVGAATCGQQCVVCIIIMCMHMPYIPHPHVSTNV